MWLLCCYGLCVCLGLFVCSCRNVRWRQETCLGSQWAVCCCVVVTTFPLRLRFGGVYFVVGLCCGQALGVPVYCLWLLRFTVLFEVMFVAGVAGKSGRVSNEVVERKRRELNARQRAYVVWMATPPAEREIQTLVELCEVLGVTKQAVWKWSKDARVQEAIRFYTLQNASSPERVQAMLNMVYDVAMEKRDVKYAEVWMRASGVMGQFGRSSDLLEVADEIVEDSISDLSLEELQRVRDLAVAERAEAAAIELARRSVG